MDGVKVYLIGHGYAPVFRVTDQAGRVLFDQAVPFTYDPGRLPALASGIAAIAGLLLSFLVRRRRVFIRAEAIGPDGCPAGARTVVEAGAIARSDTGGGFGGEFAELTTEFRSAHGVAAVPGGHAAPDPDTGAAGASPVTLGGPSGPGDERN